MNSFRFLSESHQPCPTLGEFRSVVCFTRCDSSPRDGRPPVGIPLSSSLREASQSKKTKPWATNHQNQRRRTTVRKRKKRRLLKRKSSASSTASRHPTFLHLRRKKSSRRPEKVTPHSPPRDLLDCLRSLRGGVLAGDFLAFCQRMGSH